MIFNSGGTVEEQASELASTVSDTLDKQRLCKDDAFDY